MEAAQSFQQWLARRVGMEELDINLRSSWDRTMQDSNAARASRCVCSAPACQTLRACA